jgi:hypothetical protein
MRSSSQASFPTFFPQSSSVPSRLPKNFDDVEKADNIQLPPATAPQTAAQEGKPIPFSLSLQEDSSRPGQYQLIVNPYPAKDSEEAEKRQSTGKSKLYNKHYYALPQSLPSVGYDVSPIYRSNQPPSPISPANETQGWSDISNLPSDFVRNVAPDWQESTRKGPELVRKESLRLSDIKARIKKSSKGFIVRLKKGSTSESGLGDVKDIHLYEEKPQTAPPIAELDGPSAPVELDSTPIIHEIGSSRPLNQALNRHASQSPQDASYVGLSPFKADISPWEMPLDAATVTRSNPRNSTRDPEGWFSDAETIVPPSLDGTWEDDGASSVAPRSEYESRTISRRSSVSSIVTTPTAYRKSAVQWPADESDRGGDVLNIQRSNVVGATLPKNTLASHDVVPSQIPSPTVSYPKTDVPEEQESLRVSQFLKAKPSKRLVDTSAHRRSKSFHGMDKVDDRKRRVVTRTVSAGAAYPSLRGKRKLKLQTRNLPVPSNDESDTDTQARRDGIRTSNHPPKASRKRSSPRRDAYQASALHTPETSRIRIPSLRQSTSGNSKEQKSEATSQAVGSGRLPLPDTYEIRSHATRSSSRISTFVAVAATGLLSSLVQSLTWLRDQVQESPVPAGHVRVRWTCVSLPTLLLLLISYLLEK